MIGPFKGKYWFLSNFSPAKVSFEGHQYPSVEHAYQAAKTLDETRRLRILAAKTALRAKQLGRLTTLRPDWEDVKLNVMETCLRSKFSNKSLLRSLLATGDEELAEVNWWKDTFWGICKDVGENHLGKLLMKIRDASKE